MTEWSITRSAGASGLIFSGLPPIAASASRIVARSTTAGTPVKSCRRTRAGRKAISRSVGFLTSRVASASMSSFVTVRPSSWRRRFSRRIRSENGSLVTFGNLLLDRLEAEVVVGRRAGLQAGPGLETVLHLVLRQTRRNRRAGHSRRRSSGRALIQEDQARATEPRARGGRQPLHERVPLLGREGPLERAEAFSDLLVELLLRVGELLHRRDEVVPRGALLLEEGEELLPGRVRVRALASSWPPRGPRGSCRRRRGARGPRRRSGSSLRARSARNGMPPPAPTWATIAFHSSFGTDSRTASSASTASTTAFRRWSRNSLRARIRSPWSGAAREEDRAPRRVGLPDRVLVRREARLRGRVEAGREAGERSRGGEERREEDPAEGRHACLLGSGFRACGRVRARRRGRTNARAGAPSPPAIRIGRQARSTGPAETRERSSPSRIQTPRRGAPRASRGRPR